MGKRIYTADHIRDGVRTMEQLQQRSWDYVPAAIEAMNAPVPETQDGYCLKCKGSQTFEVEGEDTMKNGAIRKYGKCPGEGCGTMLSRFVKGTKDANA